MYVLVCAVLVSVLLLIVIVNLMKLAKYTCCCLSQSCNYTEQTIVKLSMWSCFARIGDDEIVTVSLAVVSGGLSD